MKTIAKILFTIIISVISITWYTYADTSSITDTEVVNNNTSLSATLDKKITNLLNKLNNNIYNSFEVKALKNDNMFLENWVWYTYVYSQYKDLWKWIILSKNILIETWLDTKTTLLLLDDAWISFVTDYKKVKLISDYIISWITNKQEFLKELADDKKSLHSDTDNLFLSLKAETLNLTKWLSDIGKIFKIYDYILKNISYSKIYSTDNKEIFSWINTFENKIWICGGYSKLNLYMLSFAWISDVEVKTWYVLDSPVFPNVGHAWIRIWNKYYDSTYDDPIWVTKTKTYNQYKYFALPKDLFYANKFDYGTLPSYLKTEKLESRKSLIESNLSNISDKYENKNYLLLKPFAFRKDNGLVYNDQITIKTIKNIVPSFEVNNYKYTDNNQVKSITNLDYYAINDSNIETLLKQVDYNLNWYKLFKWDNWTYRLSYNVKTNNEIAYK